MALLGLNKIIQQIDNKIQVTFIYSILKMTNNHNHNNTTHYNQHPNIEIIGIDSHPHNLNYHKSSLQSLDRDRQTKSMIKEEQNQMENDLQDNRDNHHYEASIIESFGMRQNEEKVDAKSLYKSEISNINLVHHNLAQSCIANNHRSPFKGILKKSLMELQKNNISSQEDDTYNKQLYLELEKEKKLRKQLEKSYKLLVEEVNSDKRHYSVDLNHFETDQSHKIPPSSKKTVKHEPFSERFLRFQEQKTQLKQLKESPSKTIKRSFQNNDQHVNYNRNEQQYQKQEQERSSDEQDLDYFKQQSEFQEKILQNLYDLNKKIEEIDEYLGERQSGEESSKLMEMVESREQEIAKLKKQNARLLTFNKEEKESRKELDLLKHVNPTTLYLISMAIIALVAIV